jgi:hypothetical protein
VIVMRFSQLRRAAVCLTALVACVAGSFALANSAQARVVAARGASYWHPYSNPVWYPLRGSDATMDCATSNPGCNNAKKHKDQAMSLLSRTMVGKRPVYHRAAVYAAGAGILHIGRNIGNRCESTSTLGTWVWIDHGAGVLSRYGHLSGILKSIHNGMYVTPDTVIGYTGHSGEKTSGDCYRATNYLNFQIEHNGLYGTGVRLGTLRVCSGSQSVAWPSRIHSNWSTFQRVPQTSALRNAGQSATSCVKRTWMTTATLPHSSMSKHSGSVHAMWNRAAGYYHVKHTYVELQEYHPANHSWSVESRRVLTSSPKSTWFTGLQHHRIYRTQVNFSNTAGWSKSSGWHQTKVS